MLDELGLDIGVDEDTLTLDPGEQRLVMFARTFHRKARLLIADEPTAGLGEKDSRTVIDALKRLNAKGVTMIFVSHHLSEVMEICDEVTVMRDGRVAARLEGRDADARPHDHGNDRRARAARNRAARRRRARRRLIIEGRHLAMPPLRQLNFKLYENECLGFAGLLGSGREKAIDVISGAARLWGSVACAASSSRRRARRFVAGVGFLTGNRNLRIVPGWSVLKHVSLPSLEQIEPLRLHRQPPRARGSGSRDTTAAREGRARRRTRGPLRRQPAARVACRAG